MLLAVLWLWSRSCSASSSSRIDCRLDTKETWLCRLRQIRPRRCGRRSCRHRPGRQAAKLSRPERILGHAICGRLALSAWRGARSRLTTRYEPTPLRTAVRSRGRSSTAAVLLIKPCSQLVPSVAHHKAIQRQQVNERKRSNSSGVVRRLAGANN